MATNKNKENVVIIFAKKPERGMVKTRIAEETSVKFAYEFSKACFIDLLNKIHASDYYDLIIGADSLKDMSWFQKNFSLEGLVIKWREDKNKQKNQSNKFENIFSSLLGKNKLYNYKKAILIPMDIPFISEEDLIAAFARLNDRKFVYGPEVNGGVYLIAMRTPYKKGVFKRVRWSTSNSFNDLVKNSGKENTLSLKLKNDLNVPEDILSLRDEIYSNCPVLYNFLCENGYYFSAKNKYVNFDELSICIPMISNIVQRKKRGKIEILIQTRYKPTVDPGNIGKIEIPSGLVKKYELAQEATIRETEEETGIISQISKEQEVLDYTISKAGNIIAVYKPFCCCQQLKGDRAYLSMAFISTYIKGELTENFHETKNPRWVSVDNIEKLINKNPEKIFSLSLTILKEYLKYIKNK